MIAEIEKLMAEESGERIRYGVRWDTRELNVGDTLPNSYVWEDGNKTDEELDGVCAIDLSTINRAISLPQYKGNPYLIKGEYLETGNDLGEILLANAVVVRAL